MPVSKYQGHHFQFFSPSPRWRPGLPITSGQRIPIRRPAPPLRNKKLTIAAGFECNDGIILATDLEITGAAHKSLGGKSTVSCSNGNGVVIGGAGDYDVLAYACVEMTENVEGRDIASILKRLRGILKKIYLDHIHSCYEESDRYTTLQLLVGIVSGGQRRLYRSNRSVLRRVGPYAFQGIGIDLSSYLAKQWWPKDYPTSDEAIGLARKIIHEVGENVPYVGTTANIIRLDLSGHGSFEPNEEA